MWVLPQKGYKTRCGMTEIQGNFWFKEDRGNRWMGQMLMYAQSGFILSLGRYSRDEFEKEQEAIYRDIESGVECHQCALSETIENEKRTAERIERKREFRNELLHEVLKIEKPVDVMMGKIQSVKGRRKRAIDEKKHERANLKARLRSNIKALEKIEVNGLATIEDEIKKAKRQEAIAGIEKKLEQVELAIQTEIDNADIYLVEDEAIIRDLEVKLRALRICESEEHMKMLAADDPTHAYTFEVVQMR